MTGTPTPLAGRDARILTLLVRVCRIGEHDRAWTTADVRRVAARHLRPSLLASTAPAKPAGRQSKPRRPRADYPMPDVARTVDLTPRQAAALEQMRAGRRPEQAAPILRCTPGRAANLMSEVVRALDAMDRHHAVRLVDAGAITVRVRPRRRP